MPFTEIGKTSGGGGEKTTESSILNISLKTWEASEWLPLDVQLTAQRTDPKWR